MQPKRSLTDPSDICIDPVLHRGGRFVFQADLFQISCMFGPDVASDYRERAQQVRGHKWVGDSVVADLIERRSREFTKPCHGMNQAGRAFTVYKDCLYSRYISSLNYSSAHAVYDGYGSGRVV